MASKAPRSTDQKTKKKIRRKSRGNMPSASSLRKLAGGWGKREADELLASLEPFDQTSKPHKNTNPLKLLA